MPWMVQAWERRGFPGFEDSVASIAQYPIFLRDDGDKTSSTGATARR
jgi:hypothetical protein